MISSVKYTRVLLFFVCIKILPQVKPSDDVTEITKSLSAENSHGGVLFCFFFLSLLTSVWVCLAFPVSNGASGDSMRHLMGQGFLKDSLCWKWQGELEAK